MKTTRDNSIGRKRTIAIAASVFLASRDTAAFTTTNPSSARRQPLSRRLHQVGSSIPSSALSEDATAFVISRQKQKQPQTKLQAVRIGTLSDKADKEDEVAKGLQLSETEAPSFLTDEVWPILSAASLVTGSTVGASMLALPQLVAGPGFAAFSGLLTMAFFVCLISGLTIADVAINQHESGSEVPSSFKEFAETNLDSELLAKGVSVIPVLVNGLVSVFDFSKFGDLGASILAPMGLAVDPLMVSFGFVAVLGTLLTSLDGTKLSTVASLCVAVLFVAFGALLVPGLLAVQDPVAAIMSPGADGDQWLSSTIAAAPIALTALQFQNIVPSITKILNYDRQKTVAAITIGSFVPLAMYVSFCFAVLGGGIDTAGVAGPLMAIFSGVTIFGSSVGASMSVTEEVENYVAPLQESNKEKSNTFSLPAVAVTLAVPMAGVMAFSQGVGDVTAALGIAGSYGSPLLYGVIPAMMAYNQRRKADSETEVVVPGGLASIGALGLASALFVGQGIVHNLNDILTTGIAS